MARVHDLRALEEHRSLLRRDARRAESLHALYLLTATLTSYAIAKLRS